MADASPEAVERTTPDAEWLATGLGLFSIGLGLVELGAPWRMARLAGLHHADARITRVLQAFGAREIANGIAILARPDAASTVWARVAGDVLDICALRAAARAGDGNGRGAALATAGLLGITALDVYVAHRLSNGAQNAGRELRSLRVHETTTINAPIAEVYQYWRTFRFAQEMRHVDSVQVIDDRRSHWRVTLAGGYALEWDAIISEDVPDSRIIWRSEPHAPIVHAGTVAFTPATGAQGTEVRVSFTYAPPGGRLGAIAAWLGNGLLESQVREDLRRCKQVIETGEVLVSDGPALWRPARPVGDSSAARRAAGVQP
jgi:uncharacterized membrane protein